MTPETMACSLGGSSLPFEIPKPDYLPFTTILLKLSKADVYNDTNNVTVDPSDGITPTDNKLLIDYNFKGGWLRFSCSSSPSGTKLKYSVTGSSSSSFELDNDILIVTQEA